MSKTILVVDDELDLLSLLQELLEMESYEVLLARNRAEALTIWSENRERIDLLLTDVSLSKVETGTALAAQLQREKPDLRVIYSSGHSHDLAMSKYSLPDEASFLQKPFQFDALFETLKDRFAHA